jgi:hypothetical protein
MYGPLTPDLASVAESVDGDVEKDDTRKVKQT